MNLKKLKQAEKDFLKKYPGGFEHPELIEIGKKHKVEKLVDYVQSNFKPKNFQNTQLILDHMIKVMSRSSLVSVFEKPKFRDFVLALDPDSEKDLVKGLKQLLYGKQEKGFELMLKVLQTGKLGKWTMMTACQAYFKPDDEVFIKPTTAKGVISFFEIEDLVYKPSPSWDFYQKYREVFLNMKSKVDKSLSPNNPAFSGFLMVSSQGQC